MINFFIKKAEITATEKVEKAEKLHVVRCEYSGTPVLMDGHKPLMCVTSADLSALYEMLACDSSDTEVSDMIKTVSDYIDSH